MNSPPPHSPPPVTRRAGSPAPQRSRRPGRLTIWLVTALGGCAVVLVHRLLNDKTASPAASSIDTARASEVEAQPEDLRAEIARLQRIVGSLAAQQARLEKSQNSKPAPREDETAPVDPLAPSAARMTKDTIIKQYTGATADPKGSQQLEMDLRKQFGQPSFAEAGVAVEEVACRGDVCKVKVSHVQGAEPTFMIGELAGAIPDSEGFFAFDQSGDKATIETYLLRVGASARR
jgi:hypothetical protein